MNSFDRALTALSTYVYSTSVYFEGNVTFYNFGMNGLDVAPDILARSKIMEWCAKNMFCDFIVNWQPGQPLPLVRNNEEATISELQIAMVHAIRWNSMGGQSINIIGSELKQEPPPGPELCRYALQQIAECLSGYDLGIVDGDNFTFNEAGSSVPEEWEYWSRANRDRKKIGLKAQNTKSKLEKNFRKYRELYHKY